MITSDKEFLQFAFRHYDNPQMATVAEFESDISRLTYLNNLLNRYRADQKDLQHRLIINHMIILGNCFSVTGAVQLIDYKTDPLNKCDANTFLYFVKYIEMPTPLNYTLLNYLQSND